MAAAAPAKPKELLTELAAPVKREEGAEVEAEAEAEPLFPLAYIQYRSQKSSKREYKAYLGLPAAPWPEGAGITGTELVPLAAAPEGR